MYKRVTVLAALVLFAFASAAQAQQKGTIEIGTDAAFGYSLTGKLADVEQPDVFFGMIPFSAWRFGFFLNEKISIEPGIGFDFWSASDDAGSDMTITPSVDVVYNMPSGLFFHAGGALYYNNYNPGGGADSESESQFGFGGGVGYRHALADMLYLRFGGRVFYFLESEDDGLPSSIDIAGVVGFSFMTK